MRFLNRLSDLVYVNLHSVLDQAEDPERMLAHLLAAWKTIYSTPGTTRPRRSPPSAGLAENWSNSEPYAIAGTSMPLPP